MTTFKEDSKNVVSVPIRWFERLLLYADVVKKEMEKQENMSEMDLTLYSNICSLVGYCESGKGIIQKF